MMSEVPKMRVLTSRSTQNERKIVRERHGSVLSRGLVLKRDQAASDEDYALEHAVALEGAPLFREADVGLGVYGVAQPTIIGLKTALSVLQSEPKT